MKNDDQEIWDRFNKSNIKTDSGVLKKAKNIEKTVSQHADDFLFKKLHIIKEIRRKMLFWFGVLTIVLILIVVNIFISQSNYQTQFKNNRYYSEGMVGEIKTLNPLYISTASEKTIEKMIFSSLYRYDRKGNLKADLVKDLRISNDGKKYQITIKNDLKWSDGEPITAKDVKYSINAYKNESVNSFVGQTFRGVSVKILSDYTVELNLRSKYPAFQHLLTFSILPEHIMTKDSFSHKQKESFNYFPVGSGKFIVDDFIVRKKTEGMITSVILKSNKFFAKKGLDKLMINIYSNDQQLKTALSKKEVNGALLKNPSLIDVEKKQLSAKYYQTSSGVFAFLNNKSPIFKKAETRKVFRSLIGVKDIRKQYQNKYQTNVDFDFPMSTKYFDKKGLKINYLDDQVKQKQILSKTLSKKDGKYYLDNKEFVLKIVSVKDSDYQLAAQKIAQNLTKQGFKVDLKLIDAKKDQLNFNKTIFQNKNYDILVYELNFGSNFDVYSFWHSSQSGYNGLNFANYNNKVSDRLLSTARVTLDQKTRTAKYQKFVTTWIADVPAVGLYKKTFKYVHDKNSDVTISNADLIGLDDRYYDVLNWSSERQEKYLTP